MYAVAAFRRAVGIAAAYHHQAIGIAYCHAVGERLGQRPESFPSERIAVAASAIDTAVVAFGAAFGCRSVGKVGTACHHQVVSYLSGKASRHALLVARLDGGKSLHHLHPGLGRACA